MCAQLPKGCLWEMEVRPQSESAWRAIHSSSSTAPMTANDLLPGTKYVFRARAGAPFSPPLDGSIVNGKDLLLLREAANKTVQCL